MHERPLARITPGTPPPRALPAESGPVADVLALQRTAGNAATQAVLARKPNPAPPAQKAPPAKAAPATPFKVLIVDDGSSGLDSKTLQIAIGHVRDELTKLTAASTDPLVKSGFTVEFRKDAPERGTDFGRKDLDVTTWVVFLMRQGEAEKAVDLGYKYLQLDHREREKYVKNAKAHFASEGGYNLQMQYGPRKPSESISFVDSAVPLRMEKDKSFGPASAGRLMAEVVLHELGHAMGHVKREGEPDAVDHEAAGIMVAKQIIGTSGPYAPASFSRKSADLIRKRLEWLAQKIAARTPAP